MDNRLIALEMMKMANKVIERDLENCNFHQATLILENYYTAILKMLALMDNNNSESS